ncbi:unnamed protein product [Heterobilharzia americana]|nr:unnamed protein product [Heterobilharzia americana]
MLQLLKSHAFAKNKLHTKKWIIGQVRESIRPIHPLLPELLEAHITHSFGSNTNTSSSMNDMPSISGTTTTTTTTGNQSTAYINLSLISEQELINEFTNPKCSHFIQFCAPGFNMNSLNTSVDNSVKDFSSISSEGEDFTPQLLFLYYAFFVYDYQLSARLAANRHRLPDEPSCVYSDKLWDIIPITYLLQYARAHLSDYRALYPKLLQLVTNHFPQLTMGEMMIQDELLLDPIWKSEHEPVRLINALSNSVTTDTLVIPSRVMLNQTIITCHSSSSSNSSLHGLSLFSEEQLNEAFEQVISQVSCSNEPSTLKDLSETCSLWKKLISMINRLIQSMELFGLDCLLNFGTVLAEQCPRLLLLRANCGYLSVNRKFTHSLELLWRRLHLIMPRRLELITMNRIRSNDSTQSSSSSSSEMKNFPIPLDLIIKANTLNSKKKLLCSLDLRVDPVENVMSEVDWNVFRCPSVLRLFLRILESSLLASRSYWAHRLIDRVQPVRGNSTSVNTSSSTSMPAMMMTMLSSVNSNCVNGSPSTSSSPTSSTSLPTSNSNDMSNVDELNSKFVNSPRPIDIGQQTTMISSTTAVSTSSPGITSTTGNTTASSTISSIQSLTGNKVDISPQLLVNNEDCERLCTSMLLTQDSAIVQLLLEYCLPTEEEKKLGSEISILREIRIIICTFIHSLFIAQPVLAEIIVWQTYPRALIPISAQAIPSLHICLDTVIDVFRMSGDYSKMVFCLDLVSHLAQHYNIQATLDLIVSTEERSNLLYECLPSLLRLGKGFPNLAPIISRLLLSVGLMIGCTLSAETRLGLHNQFKTLNLNSHSEMMMI